jgi:3-dehydroquinate synthase
MAASLPEGAVIALDRRVARLHPALEPALARSRPRAVVMLEGAERTKSLVTVERLARAAQTLPRSGALVAIGGGTIGDVATVAAHLVKRGVPILHVPTTLLASVDSSLGGKGAVNAGGVKNALGVFHYAERTFLCSEFFGTLPEAQLREGAIEAWKMAVCLDASTWERWSRSPPSQETLVREARRLKAVVCEADPYERLGVRTVLNFGHTFGHVVESATRFRVRHGEAVGLGMLCALDVGRAVGTTSESVAREVEQRLYQFPRVGSRARLAKGLERVRPKDVEAPLAADKKAGTAGEFRMVLLGEIGDWTIEAVPASAWRPLFEAWKAGRRP